MSTQEYARQRAVELADTNPSQAFDLIIAADEMERTAAKDPAIVALNRSMRKLRTEGVKFLNSKVKDLVWEASKQIYDYIGLGSTISFYGSPNADGRWTTRIELNIGRRPAHQPPEGYDVTAWVYGKGNRTIASYHVRELTLDDLKKSLGPKVLDKATKSIKNHLSGAMVEEKERLLNYMKEALEAHGKTGPALKAAQAKIKGSKNLVGDIDDIWAVLRAIPAHNISSGVSNAIEFLRELQRSGG